MIGKPEWFSPRKFGWGLGIRTREGWMYIAAVVILMFAAMQLPIGAGLKAVAATAIAALLALDVLTIMPAVYAKLDEREQMHQLVAERNASFVAIAGIVAYALYTTMTLPIRQAEGQLLPLIGLAVVMAIAKGATLLYMEKER
jgi:hypothetical protein